MDSITGNGHNPYDEEFFNPNLWLKAEAEKLELPSRKLQVLAPQNDPFNHGTPTHWAMAKWFKGVYARYGHRDMHLRRLHYRISNSGDTVMLWDGETQYENDNHSWNKLNEAFRAARILRLVDAYDFTENRVKNPRHDGMFVYSEPEPRFWVEEPSLWSLPRAPGASLMPNIGDVSERVYLIRPDYSIEGYGYSPSMQPYLIEIWAEKSGDDETIRRIAGSYGVNYQPGIGYASITNIKGMLRRVAAHDKPTVILYVSDYDDAGRNMPVQVSRHSQFACWELEELAEEIAPTIIVDNVALTKKQVDDLRIPPTPNTDKREIDALEALHPGKLEEFITERIKELQDPGLELGVMQARRDARLAVQAEIESIRGDYEERIKEIREQTQEVVNRYQQLYQILGAKVAERYQKLSERYERHVAELREELDEIESDLRDDIENIEVDLPEVPEPEIEMPERDWLFDSRRDFVDQTMRLRRAQGKE